MEWSFKRSDADSLNLESLSANPRFGPACLAPSPNDNLQIIFYDQHGFEGQVEWWIRFRISEPTPTPDPRGEGGWCRTVKDVNKTQCDDPPIFPSDKECSVFPEPSQIYPDETGVFPEPSPAYRPQLVYAKRPTRPGPKVIAAIVIPLVLVGGVFWYVKRQRKHSAPRFVQMDNENSREDGNDLQLEERSNYDNNGILVSVQEGLTRVSGHTLLKQAPHHGIGESDDDDDNIEADYFDEDEHKGGYSDKDNKAQRSDAGQSGSERNPANPDAFQSALQAAEDREDIEYAPPDLPPPSHPPPDSAGLDRPAPAGSIGKGDFAPARAGFSGSPLDDGEDIDLDDDDEEDGMLT
eukprot:g69797.t1